MIISFLQEKGGAGKTTLTINVAMMLKVLGWRVLIVDSDPQGSARDWHEANNGERINVIGIDRPTIDVDVKPLKHLYDYILIDGAPRLSSITAKILTISDLVLIPVQPSPYDVWASQPLTELIKQRQIITDGQPKAAFIISRKIVKSNLGLEVRDSILSYGLPVLTHGTCQRVIYAESAAKGDVVMDSPASPAMFEISAITKEILEFISHEHLKTKNEG
jgi:chromosome partitioning protein